MTEARIKAPSNQDIASLLERQLLRVQKPGRYVGGELNQVVKDWDSVQTRVALLFPDIYDLGVPNLGLAILYEQLNNRQDCLAERVYSPWADMEAILRAQGIPLHTLESKRPLREFDLIGVTLPYETLYTNLLNALDLAGIPVLAAERDETYPLVIAGGQASYNPEPMWAFIDAFVIGEGEDVIHEVIEVVQQAKSHGYTKYDTLMALSGIQGVYIPSLYEAEYDEQGKLLATRPLSSEVPAQVLKRFQPKLTSPVLKPIVPAIDVVHNRIAVEIMRGCTRGCRFCHAGMVNRPVRERSVEEILAAIDSGLQNTGYEEVALMSLSSSDYSHIGELVDTINERYKGKNLTISLPSLRIESFSVDVMDKLKGTRSGGFTLAPEAASEELRRTINKPIATEALLTTAHEIYSRGWTTLKLYFMIGHPGETMADVEALASVCKSVISVGRKAIGNRAKLNIGLANFIPKPHTPFQWAGSENSESIWEKINYLRTQFKTNPGIKLNWNNPLDSQLEAWLSRGDRRMAEVIHSAWRKGAKFDAWQDMHHISLWQQAFADAGIDPDAYAYRERSDDKVFPWDHIQIGVSKRYLRQEYEKSLRGELTDDCRNGCHYCGILPVFNNLRAENPGPAWNCPEVLIRTREVES